MENLFINLCYDSMVEAAILYNKHGIQVTAIKPREKAPYLPGWNIAGLRRDQFDTELSGDKNLAALNGGLSGNLVDVDLDCNDCPGLPGKVDSHALIARYWPCGSRQAAALALRGS